MIGHGPALTHLADFVNGYGFTGDDLDGDGIPVVRIQHLLDPSVEMDRTDLDVPQVAIQPGDLVFSWSATLAARIWDREPALLNQHLFRVDPHSGVDRRWLKYVLDVAVDALSGHMHGSAMTHITRDMMRRVRVPFRSLQMQRAIADYLDTETARIDALIAKKRRMIGLLHEQAQSALLDAVGDWRTQPSRTLRQYGTNVLTGPFGTVLTASEYVEGGVPLVNPTHIRSGEIVPEPEVTVPEQVAARISRHRLSVGDVVMGRKGDVGRSAIISEREDGWVCGSDSIAIRCGHDLEPEYLATTLHIDLYRQQLARSSSGAMVLNVNEGTLLEFSLPDLDRAEQLAAIGSSRRALSFQNGLVGRLTRQLDLLAEHRQALITAAVTGELDVSKVA